MNESHKLFPDTVDEWTQTQLLAIATSVGTKLQCSLVEAICNHDNNYYKKNRFACELKCFLKWYISVVYI